MNGTYPKEENNNQTLVSLSPRSTNSDSLTSETLDLTVQNASAMQGIFLQGTLPDTSPTFQHFRTAEVRGFYVERPESFANHFNRRMSYPTPSPWGQEKVIKELQDQLQRIELKHQNDLKDIETKHKIDQMKLENSYKDKLRELEKGCLIKDYEHRDEIKDVKRQLEIQKTDFDFQINELNHKYSLEVRTLEESIKSLEEQLKCKDLEHQLNVQVLENNLLSQKIEEIKGKGKIKPKRKSKS
nr:hypothetical protein BgiMline_019392 [Biomphalaria glabrata]